MDFEQPEIILLIGLVFIIVAISSVTFTFVRARLDEQQCGKDILEQETVRYQMWSYMDQKPHIFLAIGLSFIIGSMYISIGNIDEYVHYYILAMTLPVFAFAIQKKRFIYIMPSIVSLIIFATYFLIKLKNNKKPNYFLLISSLFLLYYIPSMYLTLENPAYYKKLVRPVEAEIEKITNNNIEALHDSILLPVLNKTIEDIEDIKGRLGSKTAPFTGLLQFQKNDSFRTIQRIYPSLAKKLEPLRNRSKLKKYPALLIAIWLPIILILSIMSYVRFYKHNGWILLAIYILIFISAFLHFILQGAGLLE